MVIVDFDVDETVDVMELARQGKITTYDKLVEKLGKPTYKDGRPR